MWEFVAQAEHVSIRAALRESDLVAFFESRAPLGALFHLDQGRALVGLGVTGEFVRLPDRASKSCEEPLAGTLEELWLHAPEWLAMYRGIHQQYFHLYMGELVFRFNHRQQNLIPLIVNILRQTPFSDIQSVLVRNR